MKREDYYRYYTDLMARSILHFSDKEELVEFVAEMVANDYLQFLNREIIRSATLEEYEDFTQRVESEPSLVNRYVKGFLNETVPDTESWGYKLRTKFFRKAQSEIAFDPVTNTELYDSVLKKLRRDDTSTSEIFRATVQYKIIGDRTLTRMIL